MKIDESYKLIEFSEEELQKDLDASVIDIPFLLHYISERDKAFNKLIDRIIELEKLNDGWNALEEWIKSCNTKKQYVWDDCPSIPTNEILKKMEEVVNSKNEC